MGTVRYYDDCGNPVPRERAVRAVETITQYATHSGKRYISHVNRLGWQLSDPKKKVSFRTVRERDAWIRNGKPDPASTEAAPKAE